MHFFKSVKPAAAGTALIAALAPKELNINDPSSIRGVAKTIAAGAMSYYSGTAEKFVDLPKPHYWWQAGALMGSMLDYSHYTNDRSYDKLISTALLAQVGPNFDYMLPSHFGQEGNDDQAFWGFAVMSAAERNFPHPDENVPSWLQLGSNIWNSLSSRWNTTACGGGLLWQIFASNPNGLDYKNTVSNGGLFQISARLARATGNNTYLEWAEKVWDWTEAVGLIDADGNVYDGAHASRDCKDTNPVTFSYSAAIYLYGAAVLADYTKDQKWVERTERILGAARSFFSPFDNATNIMYEHACEQVFTCNQDMRSFKGYFSRFVYAASLFVPSIQPAIEELWHTSALAAAKACSGGASGTQCGQKWYVGGFDGMTGLGEEMCALETIQGLLVGQSKPPFRGDEITTVRTFAGSSPAKRGRFDMQLV
ncbi:glycoside hydrolase family 76 protein [Parathielavia appendiculata]|uniref:Mannan endo-1,6-alpha-mannosidase n=1 Tax=Parathielavia appendiculata TaxID=2587402 RepID=A0AAN6Z515_9PEZI|nr:glycoside hydrolase family 76 protein [Parathielavia appendiculata]